MFSTTTQGIRITAEPFFVPAQSDPVRGRFVFAYNIRIENLGGRFVLGKLPLQLLCGEQQQNTDGEDDASREESRQLESCRNSHVCVLNG